MAFLVLVDPDGPAGANRHVPVTLAYDPADPFAVRLTFHASHTVVWHLSRDLMWHGLVDSAGSGDVRMWRGGSPVGGLYLRLTGSGGTGLFAMPADDVERFVDDTYLLVPHGEERVDVDGWIGKITETQ